MQQQFTTDKIGHGYLRVYEHIRIQLGSTADVCEIGVANGEGLQLFRHLFPHGRLVGVDANAKANFREEELGTLAVISDQAALDLPTRIAQSTGIEHFDLIVDDASHSNELTKLTFLNMWGMVAKDGLYVIEDWNHAGGLCRELASELPWMLLRETEPVFPDVESVWFHHGLIAIRKKP